MHVLLISGTLTKGWDVISIRRKSSPGGSGFALREGPLLWSPAGIHILTIWKSDMILSF